MMTSIAPWITITSPGLTLISANGVAARPRGHVLARELPGLGLMDHDVLSVAPDALAKALGLPPRAFTPPSLIHGATVLRAIQDTVESNSPNEERLAELRRLSVWMPSLFYRALSVVVFLDSQTEPTRGGFFRWQSSKGRHAVHDRLLGMLLAVEALVKTQEKPKVSAACLRVAKSGALEAGVGAAHLENMFAKYGELVAVLAAGYAIPALYLTEYQWPMRADDAMTFSRINEGEEP